MGGLWYLILISDTGRWCMGIFYCLRMRNFCFLYYSNEVPIISLFSPFGVGNVAWAFPLGCYTILWVVAHCEFLYFFSFWDFLLGWGSKINLQLVIVRGSKQKIALAHFLHCKSVVVYLKIWNVDKFLILFIYKSNMVLV